MDRGGTGTLTVWGRGALYFPQCNSQSFVSKEQKWTLPIRPNLNFSEAFEELIGLVEDSRSRLCNGQEAGPI